MPPPPRPAPAPAAVTLLPLSGRLLALLCASYLLAGVLGHDPWKTDDAIHLGIVHGFLTDGNWLIPQLAGEPWTEATPLYHWVAAILAWPLRSLLPEHDAARLASALFGGIALIALSGAARALHGREAGLVAPLLAIGTLGLLVPLHDAQPAAALFATQALSYWGLAMLPTRPLRGGAVLGIGLGAGLLANGITAPLLTLPLLAVLASQHWRNATCWQGLALALAIALPLASAWPLALASHNETHLLAWWSSELRQLAPRPAIGALGDLFELFAWAAWPVWPLAVWALWLHRRRLLDPGLLLPLAGTLLGLGWLVTREAQAMHALPVMAPLILLATAGAGRLRRGAANALNWFGMMTFTLLAGLIWLGASAMLAGIPAQIARNFAKLAPGFSAETSALALLLALAVSAAWVAALIKLPKSPWRATTHWAIGLTVSWVLLNALWQPWIDYGKTYRSVAHSLKSALPADTDCIVRSGLGPSQRASLDYFSGIRTRAQPAPGAPCRLVLVQSGVRETPRQGWTRLWEGNRPGDKNERLRLYRRD